MTRTRARVGLLFTLSLFAIALALFFVLSADKLFFDRKAPSLSDYGPSQLDYHITSFADIPGWREDDQHAALLALVRSCAAMEAADELRPANPLELTSAHIGGMGLSGRMGDWRGPCANATVVAKRAHASPRVTRAAARSFFEDNFTPVEIIDRRAGLEGGPAENGPDYVSDKGLFTGYFEPVFEASSRPDARHSAPLYSRPKDLIEVELGAFRSELAGERIAGRILEGRLVPYPDRKRINAAGLAELAEPLAWLEPNDLFFLQIQGSGRLKVDGARSLRVGYAAQNGHPYTAIGRVMVERNIMKLEDVSMKSIRAWLDRAPAREARALREENASYVFFNELDLGDDDTLGPLGAQGVSLTPERSLAVDRRFYAMGAPVWVDIDPNEGEPEENRFRRLMIAQDTGGAIRGAIRGDVFWGAGDRAGEIAGAMRREGRMIMLVPRSVAGRLKSRPAS